MDKKRYLIGVLLFVFLVLTVFAFAANIDSEVLQALEKKNEVSVIVTLKDQPLPERGVIMASANTDDFSRRKEMINAVQNKVLGELNVKERGKDKTGDLGVASVEDYDFELRHRYAIINGFSGKLTKEGLAHLIATGQVDKIELDRPVKILLDGSVPQINANDVWNITVNGNPINGSGETVCVIDTGVDYTHPALGGCTNTSFLNGSCSKVIGGYDYGDDDMDPFPDGTYSSRNHGTHVAGIVASMNETYRGVAPGAKIVAIKSFANDGSGLTSDSISGIDWCVNNASRFNISVITISLAVVDGSNNEIIYNSSCDSAQAFAAEASWAANQGVFIDAAAGNNGNSTGISAPACGENVTSVSSVTKLDAISNYNSGPNLDILAPGSLITSTVLSPSFTAKSGTSMAAPHAAGAAALLKQYWKTAYNKNITPQQIENKLKITGVKINDSRNGIIVSRIDVLKAIQPFVNYTSSSPANASTIITTSTLINVTSDVNLSTVLLEWNYGNGTITNFTMNITNTTAFYYNMTGLTTTNYTYKVHGNDSAGTFGVSETRLIIVDQTTPNITIYIPANNSYFKQEFNLNISLTDLLLSFSNYSITNSTSIVRQTNVSSSIAAANFTWSDLVNISNATFPEGNYTLTVFANDSLGNSATQTRIFFVDKTNPNVINITLHPTTVYNNDSITFKINVTDNYAVNASTVYFESNFSTSWTNYSMNSADNITFNYTLRGTANLTNRRNIFYRFIAADLVRNVNASVTYNFTVQNRNITFLNITSPQNNTVIEVGVATSLNGTATDLDNDTLTYAWNVSGVNVANGSSASYTFNTTGNYTLILTVNDTEAYNFTNVSIIVNDTKPPTLSALTYDTELHLSQDGSTLRVNGTAQDYSGILNLTLSYNLIAFNGSCVVTNTTRNCNWSLGSLTVGAYNFTLNYTDNFTTTHTNSSIRYFNVTSCSDSIKNGDETATDCGGSCSACSSSSSSGGGGGGGGGGGAGGATTYIVSDAQFISGYTGSLGKGDKMKFSLSSEEHYLTMESMTSVSANFNVTSKVYRILLDLGKSIKLELDGDNYKDLAVTLNAIDTANIKANLTVLKIHEAIKNISIIENKTNQSSAKLNTTNISLNPGTPAMMENVSGTESSYAKAKEWIYLKQWWIFGGIGGVVFIVMILFAIRKTTKSGHKKKPQPVKNGYPFP